MDRPQHVQELYAAAAPVVSELRASEFFDLADRLSACLALATTGNPKERTVALQEIRGLCHIKALGDTYRSEEHTSELQSLMRISYAVFCLKKKTNKKQTNHYNNTTTHTTPTTNS